jgi:AraC-like DNA-binding protein
MILSHIQLNENLEEKILHMPSDFPYICCHVEMDTYPGGYIPWHWHDEIELIYVQKGTVEYHIKEKTVTLTEGEACFMNSNVLHMIKPAHNCHNSILLAQTFKKLFLSGFYNSIFEKKYINPIVNCKNLEYFKFTPEISAHIPILEKLKISYDLAEAEPLGYEFTVRDLLSSFWLLLLEQAQPIVNKKKIKSSVENERIKAMITYVQNNYQYKITVKDIAASVNVSDRVCYRCFMRNIGMTPVEYLLQCRIRAAEDLLTSTSRSITEIGTLVGFNNGSYFGKAFQAVLHCTPREYRKKHLSS